MKWKLATGDMAIKSCGHSYWNSFEVEIGIYGIN
jgi:hypothetical protein